MKRISYFKKIKLFLYYRREVNKIRTELENQFNSRVDGASRIYTVLNVPSSLIEEPYNLRKEDIDSLSKNFIQDYSKKLSIFLNSKGLMELYDFYDIKKVDKYSYLVIFGFSLFNSTRFIIRFYITISILITSLVLSLLYFL
jgi:hypothetical protein